MIRKLSLLSPTSIAADQLNWELQTEELQHKGNMEFDRLYRVESEGKGSDMLRPHFVQNVKRAAYVPSEEKGPIATELSLETPVVATTPARGLIDCIIYPCYSSCNGPDANQPNCN